MIQAVGRGPQSYKKKKVSITKHFQKKTKTQWFRQSAGGRRVIETKTKILQPKKWPKNIKNTVMHGSTISLFTVKFLCSEWYSDRDVVITKSMWRQFWECGDECGFGRHKQRLRYVWIKQCIQWWVRRRWWRLDIFRDFTSSCDIMCATQGCMVMKETLAVTECWQKEIKNQEKQTKTHSKKRRKPQKYPPKKIQHNVFSCFSRFVRNAPWTQNLTTGSVFVGFLFW